LLPGERSQAPRSLPVMTNRDSQTPVTAFVDALVDVGAQLATILDHMATYPSPDAEESPTDVLRRLLGEIFEEELRCQPGELEIAADVLSTAATAIEENLFLVPPPTADPPV